MFQYESGEIALKSLVLIIVEFFPKGLEPIVFGTNLFKLVHLEKLSKKHRMLK